MSDLKTKTTTGVNTGRQMEFECGSKESATGNRVTIRRSCLGGERKTAMVDLSTAEAVDLRDFLVYNFPI